MGDKADTELILVLAVMLAIFLFGLAAVVIFWRVWRKEHKDKRGGESPDGPTRRESADGPRRGGVR